MANEHEIAHTECEKCALRRQITELSHLFEEKITELSTIKEAGYALKDISNFTRVCRSLLDVVMHNTPAENCSVMLYDSDRDELFLVAASDPDDNNFVLEAKDVLRKKGLRYTFKSGVGVAGRAVRSRKTMVVQDTATCPDFHPAPDAKIRVGSLLSVPLFVEDAPLGVLNVSHSTKNVFNENDIQLFNILSNYMALVIHSALEHEKLKNSEQRYRILAENSNDGIAILQDGRHTYANPKYQGLTGYTLEELESLPFDILIDTADSGGVDLNIRPPVLLNALKAAFEIQILTKTGKKVDVEIGASAIEWEGEETIIVTLRDLTERKLLERQLVQAQKMEAIGTLAGGIAHDFNNILAAIVGYSELLVYDAPQGTLLHSNLDEILKAGQRATDLVKQILTFSRQTEQERRPLQIRLVIKEALRLLRSTLPSTIEIRQDIDADQGYVLADPTQIHQVVMNLCTNAAHAMSEMGGVMEVSLRRTDIGVEKSSLYPKIRYGPYVVLTVSDTGHGMTPDIVESIFDPYFTTKEKGEGTGLGLSVVHGIVKSHHGKITVESVPGKGTTFRVYLPAIEQQPSVEPAEDAELPTGTENILFLDDELSIATMRKTGLERLGYSVVSMTNSLDALELFRRESSQIDLIITDMTMPHMPGDRFAREVIKIRPDIPVILCTGYSKRISEQQAKAAGIQAFLLKPVTLKDLAITVRKVLDKHWKAKSLPIRE